MVFVREEPVSEVVLTPDELVTQMTADGKTEDEIAAARTAISIEVSKRQADYDKNPPSVAYKRVPA